MPIATVENNVQYPKNTNEWKHYRTDTLVNMEHTLPTRKTPAQVMTHTNLDTYLQTTSHLELGCSLARQSNHTILQDIWLVTYPLFDTASHLQDDISHLTVTYLQH